MDINEINSQRACSDFEEGVYMSYFAAARASDISRDTLCARLHGRPCRRIAHKYRQRLTNIQEC